MLSAGPTDERLARRVTSRNGMATSREIHIGSFARTTPLSSSRPAPLGRSPGCRNNHDGSATGAPDGGRARRGCCWCARQGVSWAARRSRASPGALPGSAGERRALTRGRGRQYCAEASATRHTSSRAAHCVFTPIISPPASRIPGASRSSPAPETESGSTVDVSGHRHQS
jgi:hypothetical protein